MSVNWSWTLNASETEKKDVGEMAYQVPAASGLSCSSCLEWASQGARVVKYPPASAGDVRDIGSILGSGRSPEEGITTHSKNPMGSRA